MVKYSVFSKRCASTEHPQASASSLFDILHGFFLRLASGATWTSDWLLVALGYVLNEFVHQFFQFFRGITLAKSRLYWCRIIDRGTLVECGQCVA